MSEFRNEIESAYNKAISSPKGGSDEWNELVLNYGITPLSPDEKKLLLETGAKINKGAFPIELRRVYEKIKEKYSEHEFDIESEIKNYDKKIKPSAALGSIFKNASDTSKKYSQGLKGEKHHTIKCKCCGASRLEEMQYDVCLYCGSKLFENN
jgi:hypothetical protein